MCCVSKPAVVPIFCVIGSALVSFSIHETCNTPTRMNTHSSTVINENKNKNKKLNKQKLHKSCLVKLINSPRQRHQKLNDFSESVMIISQ